MNKKELYLHSKYIAFVNHFKKVADPQGLVWYITTGRLSGSELHEIINTIGDKFGNTSVRELCRCLNTYGKSEWRTSTVDSKPKVNKQLKDMAEKYANMIYPRHALYAPKAIIVKEEGAN